MKQNPVRWFELYVNDMERAQKFYESVFENKLQKLPGTDLEIRAFPMEKDAPGASGALVKMEGLTPGSNSSLVYFGCDDCAVQAKRVLAAGGKIHKEKFSIGMYGHIALVYDTEGNMFGLHSMD